MPSLTGLLILVCALLISCSLDDSLLTNAVSLVSKYEWRDGQCYALSRGGNNAGVQSGYNEVVDTSITTEADCKVRSQDAEKKGNRGLIIGVVLGALGCLCCVSLFGLAIRNTMKAKKSEGKDGQIGGKPDGQVVEI